VDLEFEDLASLELGSDGSPLRAKLVEAVLRGEKTATSSLLSDYAPHTDDQIPGVAERFLLVGMTGEPVGVVETTELCILRMSDIDLAFAIDEGEGFTTVAEWRSDHERFWAGVEIHDETKVVAMRFRLVETFGE
jgi:uncharacterized protein YhfF